MGKELDKAFQIAFQKASNMTKQLPQDVMLNFYAYYKQATTGDNFSFENYHDGRNAFKFNAWMQLRGLTPDEAKEKYIELVNIHTK